MKEIVWCVVCVVCMGLSFFCGWLRGFVVACEAKPARIEKFLLKVHGGQVDD